MCLKDSPKVMFSGVTEEDSRIIVDAHNFYRGNSYPEAEDMQKVVKQQNFDGTRCMQSRLKTLQVGFWKGIRS